MLSLAGFGLWDEQKLKEHLEWQLYDEPYTAPQDVFAFRSTGVYSDNRDCTRSTFDTQELRDVPKDGK